MRETSSSGQWPPKPHEKSLDVGLEEHEQTVYPRVNPVLITHLRQINQQREGIRKKVRFPWARAVKTNWSASAKYKCPKIRGRMLADQGGKCFFYVEKQRNKAEPKEAGDCMEENELSHKLELTIRRPISENRHRTKF